MRNIAPRTTPRSRHSNNASGASRLTTSFNRAIASACIACCAVRDYARAQGVSLPFSAVTPYINTIRADDETPLPGSQEIERRIKSLVRWNAMAMVVRAQPCLRRHRRPHLHLCVRRDAVRSRVQSLF